MQTTKKHNDMELKQLRTKVTYLEDRIEVMAKSIGSINRILGRFQMTENNDTAQGFKDIDTHELI
tara:strand:- start:93 stop:287 length:195 start_codon:yes stop_codon:yes gene_type:complete